MFLCLLNVTKSFSLNTGKTLSTSSTSFTAAAADADAYRLPRIEAVGTMLRVAIAVLAGIADVARAVMRRAETARGRKVARRMIREHDMVALVLGRIEGSARWPSRVFAAEED
jgi:4'-phosphopantetheinyl transferase EntD